MPSTRMTAQEILDKQLEWHGKSSQGCIFAGFLFNQLPPESKIHHEVIDKPVNDDLLVEIDTQIKEHIIREDSYILSFILPQFVSLDNLKLFVECAKKKTNWIVSDTERWKGYQLVKIRVPFEETDEKGNIIYSWMLGLAPLDFLPKTRQSPFTEILLITKSKYSLKKAHNRHNLNQQTPDSKVRKGEADEAHLADVYIPEVTDNVKRDNQMWEGSSGRKRKLLTDTGRVEFDDTNAKAKVTFSYPVS